MKLITLLGTRPEIVRLSLIIPKLDKLLGKNHILIHTGQNYDKSLSAVFFKELGIRKPDYYFGARGSPATQISTILRETEKVINKIKPDKVLLLGDTNTDLASIIVERMGIPIYHLEAGNRAFDLEIPEEVNRRIIDHISSYNFPYTPGSRENLIIEGIPKNKIITSGNPIYEVIQHYTPQINASKILKKLKLEPKKFFIVTCHRQECVDRKKRLEQIILGLELVAKKYNLPIIVSVHPHTRKKLEEWKIVPKNKNIKFIEPLGLFDFVKLEKNALCMISDSGTCCEEGTILRTPTIICRNSTERPETIEMGSAILSGINAKKILECVDFFIHSSLDWKMPIGYTDHNVSDKIIKYLVGK